MISKDKYQLGTITLQLAIPFVWSKYLLTARAEAIYPRSDSLFIILYKSAMDAQLKED